MSYYVIGIPKGETKADWKVDRRGGAAGELPPDRCSDALFAQLKTFVADPPEDW